MEKTEIKAVDMVRQIRDRQYEQLKGKSPEEVLQFYRREATAAKEEALGRLADRAAIQSVKRTLAP